MMIHDDDDDDDDDDGFYTTYANEYGPLSKFKFQDIWRKFQVVWAILRKLGVRTTRKWLQIDYYWL